jgi:hypothetical protein
MSNKPHLVLNWTFDIPNHRLFIQLSDELEYEAINGGRDGFTKRYKGVETHVDIFEWQETEKFWISENYGHIYGYFQPDQSRITTHPEFGWPQICVNGLGPDGQYIDHMQRMQIVLEGHDMAQVYMASTGEVFQTPDNGKTIYRRDTTRNVKYPPEMMTDDAVWPEWPQACLMQPFTKGAQLSSHAELKEFGASRNIVNKCLAGEWPAPRHPELQQWYIYPTKQ